MLVVPPLGISRNILLEGQPGNEMLAAGQLVWKRHIELPFRNALNVFVKPIFVCTKSGVFHSIYR